MKNIIYALVSVLLCELIVLTFIYIKHMLLLTQAWSIFK